MTLVRLPRAVPSPGMSRVLLQGGSHSWQTPSASCRALALTSAVPAVPFCSHLFPQLGEQERTSGELMNLSAVPGVFFLGNSTREQHRWNSTLDMRLITLPPLPHFLVKTREQHFLVLSGRFSGQPALPQVEHPWPRTARAPLLKSSPGRRIGCASGVVPLER